MIWTYMHHDSVLAYVVMLSDKAEAILIFAPYDF